MPLLIEQRCGSSCKIRLRDMDRNFFPYLTVDMEVNLISHVCSQLVTAVIVYLTLLCFLQMHHTYTTPHV
jgi:hypothetical protein